MGRAVPSLLLGLAPDGGYLAARVTTNAGGLLHHLFTVTPSLALPRVRGEGTDGGSLLFCGPFPRVACAPAWVLPSTVPYGARTFLVPRNAHKCAPRAATAWPTWASIL
jgi:hypothetical protein